MLDPLDTRAVEVNPVPIRAAVAVTFDRGDRTPASILWSGVLEWTDPGRMNQWGFPTRVLRIQCSLMRGSNGPFLSMPHISRLQGGVLEPLLDPKGNRRRYVEIGDVFQTTGTAAVMDSLRGGSSGPTRMPTAYDAREAQRQTSLESGGADDGSNPGYDIPVRPAPVEEQPLMEYGDLRSAAREVFPGGGDGGTEFDDMAF